MNKDLRNLNIETKNESHYQTKSTRKTVQYLNECILLKQDSCDNIKTIQKVLNEYSVRFFKIFKTIF